MKRQSVLGGSLLLMASAVIAKILGAVFRIPLTAMLGGEGMGYFSSAYGLFLPVFSLSVTGINTAVATLTAKLLAQNDDRRAWVLYRRSLGLFAGIGLLGSILLFYFSKPLCTYFLGNPGAQPAVRCFAPAIFFCCMNAVLRGVWEGRQDMRPTAVSQAVESAARLLFGLILCRFVLDHPNLPILSDIPPAQASAAAAILGVTISTAVGTLLLLFRPIPRPLHHTLPRTDANALLRTLRKLLIPISAAALVTNLTSIADLVTGMRGLEQMILKNPQQFSAFRSPEKAANFLYGAYAGMSVTIFHLIPSLSNMLGKGVLPAFAASFTAKNTNAMSRHAASALQAAAFLSVPAGLGIFALSQPILMMLFPTRPDEISAAAPPLMLLGLAVIPLALSIPLMSMLQAADSAPDSARITLAGVAVKLTANLILIPKIGLMGMAYSTLLCYLVILICAAFVFRKKTAVEPHLLRISANPLISGALCAVGAASGYPLLLHKIAQPIALLLSVILGGGIYLLSMWCLHTPRPFSPTQHKKAQA